MKLKSKFFGIINIIIYSLFMTFVSTQNKYESFYAGCAKSFKIPEADFKANGPKDWANGSSEDADKSVDSFKALSSIIDDCNKKLKGHKLHCTLKNKIKEHLIKTAAKANQQDESLKAKTKAFLQINLNSLKANRKRNKKSKTKWGAFSDIENDIPKIQKKVVEWVKSPIVEGLAKGLKAVQTLPKSDYKAKESAEQFQNAVKYIGKNISGFLDFWVNFMCDSVNWEKANDALQRSIKAPNDLEKWKCYGEFVGKVMESIADNTSMAR